MLILFKKDGRKIIHCPGCEKRHTFPFDPKKNITCKVTGTVLKPTIVAKLKTVSIGINDLKINCLLEVKDGMIIYDNEFTNHKYKGQTIPMVNINLEPEPVYAPKETFDPKPKI
jgi:hypothetical protein